MTRALVLVLALLCVPVAFVICAVPTLWKLLLALVREAVSLSPPPRRPVRPEDLGLRPHRPSRRVSGPFVN